MTLAIVLMPDGARSLQAFGAGLVGVFRLKSFDFLEHLQMLGVTRIIFPSREYRSTSAGGRGGPLYATVRLFPRGDDGGFADDFLKASLDSRHTDDT